MLLPKKERGSAAAMPMLLLPALRRFFQGKPPVRITPCVLVFRHVYARTGPWALRGPRQHRDQHGRRLCGPLRHGGRQNPPAASMNVLPKATGSARKSMWYPNEFPQWLLSEKSMPEEVELLKQALKPKELSFKPAHFSMAAPARTGRAVEKRPEFSWGFTNLQSEKPTNRSRHPVENSSEGGELKCPCCGRTHLSKTYCKC